MQKLELDIFPLGHVFYIARSVKRSRKVKTIIDGVEWERYEDYFDPKAESRTIFTVDISIEAPEGTRIKYWAGRTIHRIDHANRIFDGKIYSHEEVAMFKDADEAWAFAKGKADAGEEYYGPE